MKEGSLIVLERNVKYLIRESTRAKRLRVAVYSDGDVIVTKPINTPHAKVNLFLESKKLWIINKQDQKKHPSIKELSEGSYEHFETHKDDARVLVHNKLSSWSKKLNLPYEYFIIKKHKSRWGSCSKNNVLSFNYKLLFLPEDLQDYIVVHELCHTKRKDHSKYFWALVSNSLPDYNKLRIKIRSLS